MQQLVSQWYNALSPVLHGLFFFFFLLLWQHEVEDNGDEEDEGNAVLGEDGADELGEDVEDGWHGGEAEANGKRETDDDHVALGETAARHHAKAGKDNASEHHYGAAAENGLRNGGENGTNGWHKAAENKDNGSCGNGKAVDNLGEGGKTYVLRERGYGRAAEESRNGADETVASHRSSHLLVVDIASECA